MQDEIKPDHSFQATAELGQALLAYGSALTHPAGTVLFARGSKAQGLFLLQSGSAKLTIPGAIDRSVGPGSLLGVPATLSKAIYSLTAELLEESQVLFVPSERVTALLTEHPELGFQIVQILSREIQEIRRRISELNSGTVLP